MSRDNLAADVLTEFLEVALHSILYVRNLYPRQIFAMRKKYQIPIHVSRHPRVNDYLNGCLKTIKFLLELDALKEVSLAITCRDEVVERFVFAFRVKGNEMPGDYLVGVEQLFREYLLRLAVMEASSDGLPEESTFAIHLTTDEQCYVRLNESPDHVDFPWIESEAEEWSDPERRIVPVKSAECSLFDLNVYVER